MAPRRVTGSFFVIALGIALVLGIQNRDVFVREWRLLLLHSPDPEVRRAAALHLGRPGWHGAAPGLIALLEREPEAVVRDEAALALGEIGPGIGRAGVAALLAEADARAAQVFT